MLTAIKYRIYPTKAQQELIRKHFGCVRVVYNYFLDYRQKQYAQGIKETYFTMQKTLTKLKAQANYAYLNECNSQSLQMALRQLVTAFDNFFTRRAKYPNFKSKRNPRQSFAVPQNISLDNKKVYVPKFKEGIKVKIHKTLDKDCAIKQAVISCVADTYYISVFYENNKSIPKPLEIKKAVGLDMNLENLLITSDRIIYSDKKKIQDKQSKLKKLQRRLSKKKKGSNNRKKAFKKIARLHNKINLARDDYLHKITNEITNQYDFIALGTFDAKSFVGNNRLSESVASFNRHKLIRMLTYKAEIKGKTLMLIDKFFPAYQICSYCGADTGKKSLHMKRFACPHCNKTHNRDLNASINIRRYALGMIDDRHRVKIDKSRVGITRSYACGDSSVVMSRYGDILESGC